MAWIESHQELARHPKTKKLARLLGVRTPAIIGHLHLFWWWAMDYASDGNLARYEPADIADAMDWDQDAQSLVESLHNAGFIDMKDDGTFQIHDWYEYAGRLIERRAEDAERKRKGRSARQKTVTTIEDIPGTSGGRPTDGARNRTVPIPNQNNTTAASEMPPEICGQKSGKESYYAAYRRAFNRDMTPMQSEQLGKYIDDEGFEEAVIIRAIERAALKAGNFNLVVKILNDYADGGAKTIQGAEAYDAAFEQSKSRSSPSRNIGQGRQSDQLNMLDRLEKELAIVDTG